MLVALLCVLCNADPVSELADAVADIKTTAPADAKFIRYLSFYNIKDPEVLLKRSRVTKFQLNSLSTRELLHFPRMITDSLYRFDARGYTTDTEKWLKAWDDLAAKDPYFFYTREELTKATGTERAVVRADVFHKVSSVDPSYSAFLGYGATFADVAKQFRVDIEANTKIYNIEEQAAILRSRVALGKNRQIVRWQTVTGKGSGSWWYTRDVLTEDGRRSVINEQSIFAIKFDAGETIFDLPNGLHGYFLFDGEQKLIPVADFNVAQDYQTPNPNKSLKTAVSCMGCHNKEGGGYQKIYDPEKGHVIHRLAKSKRLGFDTYTFEQKQKLNSLYFRDLEKRRLEDNLRYAEVVEEVCGMKPEELGEEYENALYAYENEGVDIKIAQNELGMTEEDLNTLAERLQFKFKKIRFTFGLLLDGETISRDVWEKDVFPALLELKYEKEYK